MLHQFPADVEQNMESVTTVAWQDASWQIVIIKKDDKSFWITLPIFVSHFVHLQNNIAHHTVLSKQTAALCLQRFQRKTTGTHNCVSGCKWQLSSFKSVPHLCLIRSMAA